LTIHHSPFTLHHPPPQFPVLRFIILVTLFKGLLAFVLELGNDEAYYRLYAQKLQWNYFDHPPMVAYWIRLFTLDLKLEHIEGFLRMGSLFASAAATWLMYRTVSFIHSEKAGWFAAVLYQSSFYSAITAGLFILPDAPQMLFWTGSMYLITRILKDENRWSWWMLFGLVSGLCMLSKAHGIFLWLGMGGYILFFKRNWLKKPQIYLALLLTIILLSPVLIWNLQHDFITWKSHSQRFRLGDVGLHFSSFLSQLGSQAGFNNPVVVGLIIISLVHSFQKRIQYNVLLIFNITGLSLALVVLMVSLFMPVTMPHWSGPAFVSLMPLAAIRLSEIRTSFFPGLLRFSLAICLLGFLGYAAVVQYFPGTWGEKENAKLGQKDLSLDMYGWEEAGNWFIKQRKADIEQGLVSKENPVVTSLWWGAHIEYYFCLPSGINMVGLGKPGQVGVYLWLNAARLKHVDMNQAYCIIPSDDAYGPPTNYYHSVEKLHELRVLRNGKPAKFFYVYLLKGLKKEVPIAGS
jgi:4-amino-4-deoxy-L-arabinose transferase-like glycosyltransferase